MGLGACVPVAAAEATQVVHIVINSPDFVDEKFMKLDSMH